MVIKKILETIIYSASELTFIKSKLNMHTNRWNDGEAQNRLLKKKIKKDLIKAHKNNIIDFNVECAYCGCWVGVSGRGEIEHIAHKSKYIVFEYHNTNLVYVCSHCNSSSKKGQKDVVTNWGAMSGSININHPNIFDHLKDVYNSLEFKIVHPKIDNPEDHFKWKDANKTVLVHLTEKGRTSTEMFKLHESRIVLQRIMQRKMEKDFLENPDNFKKTLELV